MIQNWNKLIPFLILGLLLFIPPAAAYETMEFHQVTEFHALGTDELHIVEIQTDNIHNAANHSFILNSYGEVYTLDVDMYSLYNLYWVADLTLEYPNGTSDHIQLSRIATAWDYDINIQFSQLYDLDPLIDVDIYIGLLPLSAEWNEIPTIFLMDTHNYVPFSDVYGTSTQPMDVIIHYMTHEEFAQVQEGGVLDNLFAWTWETILDFIDKIPYVGPYFAALLELTALTLEELVWVINFLLVENIEITILLVEFFIIAHAMLSTRSLIALLKRILDDHIAVMGFAISCLLYVRDFIMWVINAVTDIIRAVKPI
jgi:hypothetical protein